MYSVGWLYLLSDGSTLDVQLQRYKLLHFGYAKVKEARGCQPTVHVGVAAVEEKDQPSTGTVFINIIKHLGKAAAV